MSQVATIALVALAVLLVVGFFALMFSAMASKRAKGRLGPRKAAKPVRAKRKRR